MYNYLIATSGTYNIYINPSNKSERIKTVTAPLRLRCNSDSNSLDIGKGVLQECIVDGKHEIWILLKDGGWIKYADYTPDDDDEGGMYNKISATIAQLRQEVQEQGVVNQYTSKEQAWSNQNDDQSNYITETVQEGLLESSSGYLVPIDELEQNLKNSKSFSDGTDAADKFYKIKSVLGILGLPYQFMPHVDVRYDSSSNSLSNEYENTGVDYAEKIIASMPLLMITPGKPNFLSGYNTEEKKNGLKALLNQYGGNTSSDTIDQLINSSGRFYTFEPTAPEYFKYLNPMARICARLMDVQDETLDGTHLDNIDWMTYTQNQVKNIVDLATDYMTIPIYIDSDTNISENFSNDTTESSLASTINSFSDMGRELGFLLGYAGSNLDVDFLASSGNLSNNQIMEDIANKLMTAKTDSSLFKSLGKTIGSIATGGKLIFPKIWSDSSFSRSYDVNIKLRSPDHDNLSLYYNIILPMCFLICLTQPRMLTNNPNAYASPFLVRASYKGFFNVDMGIISSLNFSKGDEAQWTNMGIPTTVDVSMTITDLYDSLSITPTTSSNFSYDTLDNTALMDYLMTMCGINVYKPEISRMLDMWFVNNFENRARDFLSLSLWGNIRQSISTSITKIYRGI